MGFGLGCHSNCSGSSQTLGNPPVTLADLSPPKPRTMEVQAPEAQDAFQRSRQQPCQPPPCLAQPSRPQVQLSWARAAWPVPKASVGPPPPTLVPALTAPHHRAQRVSVQSLGKAPTHWEHFIQVKPE